MNEPNTQLATYEPRGIELNSLADMREFAEVVIKSQLAPPSFKTPEAVLIAIQMGAEVGLAPMNALQNIAVINGRPTIYGDAALGLVRASGLLEAFDERIERGSTDDDTAAFCKVQRKGFAPSETKFSVAMAKKAKLWGKTGPWELYPQRMLQFRARSWALRDNFADILKGLSISEEVQDYAPMKRAEIKPATTIQLPDEEPVLAIAEEAAQ